VMQQFTPWWPALPYSTSWARPIELGPGAAAARSAGSGKTYLAERLHGLLSGTIALPHAVMVDGEVLPFLDPMLHTLASDAAPPADPRWVRALRPTVLTGGELTLDMLDLQFDPGARLYQAPLHLKPTMASSSSTTWAASAARPWN